MKRTILLAFVALLGLTACHPGADQPPVPAVGNIPGDIKVYVGFRLTNAQVEPVYGLVGVVITAKNKDNTNLGPGSIDTKINNSGFPHYGKNNGDGSWSYPFGISRGAGAVTISITVNYFADPNEILSCFIAGDPEGRLGQMYDDQFTQAGLRRTLLTVSCGTVVTN